MSGGASSEEDQGGGRLEGSIALTAEDVNSGRGSEDAGWGWGWLTRHLGEGELQGQEQFSVSQQGSILKGV